MTTDRQYDFMFRSVPKLTCGEREPKFTFDKKAESDKDMMTS